jgi:integrase
MRVYKRGERGTWWVDFTVDGQRVKRSSGTTDESKAREWGATLASDLWRQRRLGEAPAVTWDAAVLSWLEEHQHLRSLEEVKRNLRWLTERLQGKQLAAITPDLIRKIASQRKAQLVNADAIARAAAAGQKPPAPVLTSTATVNRHLSDLSRILNHAHEQGWLPVLPAIAKAPEPAKRVAWITHEQARTLLAELPDHLQAMARFALATGLRESNVRLLEWSQVDLSRSLAWVHADQAKAGKDLAVPLNADACDVLIRQQGLSKKWVFPVPRLDTKTASEPHDGAALRAPGREPRRRLGRQHRGAIDARDRAGWHSFAWRGGLPNARSRRSVSAPARDAVKILLTRDSRLSVTPAITIELPAEGVLIPVSEVAELVAEQLVSDADDSVSLQALRRQSVIAAVPEFQRRLDAIDAEILEPAKRSAARRELVDEIDRASPPGIEAALERRLGQHHLSNWRWRVLDAIRDGSLRVRRASGILVSAEPARQSYEQLFVSARDLASWLEGTGLQPAFRSGQAPGAVVLPEADGAEDAPAPLQAVRAQELAILRALRAKGFDPLSLPVPAPGKSSPARQAAKAGTSYSKNVFDKAWKRLRKDGTIKDAG